MRRAGRLSGPEVLSQLHRVEVRVELYDQQHAVSRQRRLPDWLGLQGEQHVPGVLRLRTRLIRDALPSSCSTCAGSVCQKDPFCCSGKWDTICTTEAERDPYCSCKTAQ
jgi:hypothetical protein